MSQAIRDLLMNEEKIKEIANRSFDIIETDKSGQIDKKEFKEVLTSLAMDMGAEPPTDEDVQETIKKLDKDQNGQIDKKEFAELIKQVLESLIKNSQDDIY